MMVVGKGMGLCFLERICMPAFFSFSFSFLTMITSQVFYFQEFPILGSV